MTEFQAHPKTPRWNREVVITEKIDGTNSAIIIDPYEETWQAANALPEHPTLLARVEEFAVRAQSRNRLIAPGKTTDNYGFAAWVQENAGELVKLLGPGRHFGEWYGQGIARNYGLDHKRFALFNTKRWGPITEGGNQLDDARRARLAIDCVPVLAVLDSPSERDYCDLRLDEAIEWLEDNGSAAVPGFARPEGVILYHTASGQVYKILLEGDELPKGVYTRRERELAAV